MLERPIANAAMIAMAPIVKGTVLTGGLLPMDAPIGHADKAPPSSLEYTPSRAARAERAKRKRRPRRLWVRPLSREGYLERREAGFVSGGAAAARRTALAKRDF